MSAAAGFSLPHEHAFDIRINFDKRWSLDAVPGGTAYGFTSVGAGGTVSGPLLNGTVVDYSGADWPAIRGDRVVELNAHYMLLAEDGTRIYIRNLGYVHGPVSSSDRPADAAPNIPPYFCCTPYFRAPAGPHEWLNRTVIVGIGQRRPKVEPTDEPDHTLFRYFAIR